MLLNRFERILVNNPVRPLIQKYFEAPRLLSMGGKVSGGKVLEIGCGVGIGIELILDKFGAELVDAFDLDPKMVDLARHRLKSRGSHVNIWQGDGATIDAKDNTYDAVFAFGVLHHIPKWQDSLKEIRRVLKPGGQFYSEEVLGKFIHNFVVRRVLDHPMKNRFNFKTYCETFEKLGFKIVSSKQMWGWFVWLVAKR